MFLKFGAIASVELPYIVECKWLFLSQSFIEHTTWRYNWWVAWEAEGAPCESQGCWLISLSPGQSFQLLAEWWIICLLASSLPAAELWHVLAARELKAVICSTNLEWGYSGLLMQSRPVTHFGHQWSQGKGSAPLAGMTEPEHGLCLKGKPSLLCPAGSESTQDACLSLSHRCSPLQPSGTQNHRKI